MFFSTLVLAGLSTYYTDPSHEWLRYRIIVTLSTYHGEKSNYQKFKKIYLYCVEREIRTCYKYINFKRLLDDCITI